MIQKVVEQRKEVDVTRTAAMGHQAAGSPKKGGEVRGPPFFFLVGEGVYVWVKFGAECEIHREKTKTIFFSLRYSKK